MASNFETAKDFKNSHEFRAWLNAVIPDGQPEAYELADKAFFHNSSDLDFRLFHSWPGKQRELLEIAFGQRLYWFSGPSHLITDLDRSLHFTSIVSSRISHDYPAQDRWFRKLLHACRTLNPNDDLLLIADEVTTGPITKYLAQRLGIEHALLFLPKKSLTWKEWLKHRAVETVSLSRFGSRPLSIFVSPPIGTLEGISYQQTANDNSHLCANSIALTPDSFQVLSADLVHAIEVREGGNIAHSLDYRFESTGECDVGSVRIYQFADELSPKTSDCKVKKAVNWVLLDSADKPSGSSLSRCESGQSAIRNPTVPLRLMWQRSDTQTSDYLTHCTRAMQNHWPDESLEVEWDRWLLREHPTERSPLESLRRIVTQQRLRARPGLVRNDVESVSLSEVPLLELLSRRRYRNHLRRWDWEPYGVCIRKDALLEHPCQPVIYGDETIWKSLPSFQRSWYQPAVSKNGKEDWRNEKEWRHLGDLNLSELRWESIFVFVPTRQEAKILSQECRWTVVWLWDDCEDTRQSS
jgi:hypothetical protein